MKNTSLFKMIYRLKIISKFYKKLVQIFVLFSVSCEASLSHNQMKQNSYEDTREMTEPMPYLSLDDNKSSITSNEVWASRNHYISLWKTGNNLLKKPAPIEGATEAVYIEDRIEPVIFRVRNGQLEFSRNNKNILMAAYRDNNGKIIRDNIKVVEDYTFEELKDFKIKNMNISIKDSKLQFIENKRYTKYHKTYLVPLLLGTLIGGLVLIIFNHIQQEKNTQKD